MGWKKVRGMIISMIGSVGAADTFQYFEVVHGAEVLQQLGSIGVNVDGSAHKALLFRSYGDKDSDYSFTLYECE